MVSQSSQLRAWSLGVLLLALLTLVLPAAVRPVAAPTPPRQKLVWFTPGPGTLDMRDLFVMGSPWPAARSHVSVFKFYQQQTVEPVPGAYFLPNDYRALREVGAFRTVTERWHKQIAVEVGVVKPQYCSADGSAERAALRDTVRAIWDVEAAGGHVDYLAMDEPFLSGVITRSCGGPDPGPAADRIARYVRFVERADPGVAIGLIEPYPYFSATRLGQFLDLMRSRGVVLRFFHLDAGVNQMPPAALAGVPDDLRYLAGFCAAMGTRFGMIFNGDNPDSAALYANGVTLRLQLAMDAFGQWNDMPDDLIFQSWAQSSSGRAIIPPNLPETAPDTATGLIDRGWNFLHGQ